MLRLVVVAAVSVAAVAAGAGGARAATGCDPQHPFRVGTGSASFDVLLLDCASAGMRSQRIANTSYSVFVIRPQPLSSAPSVAMRVEVPLALAAADAAAAVAVSGGCDLRGICVVPPGGVVTADGTAATYLHFAYDVRRTLARNAAIAVVDAFLSKRGPPGRGFVSAAGHCATAAGSLVQDPSDWVSDVRSGFEASSSCRTVARALEGGEHASQETRASAEVVDVAKSIFRGVWIDEMIELAGRVAVR